MKNKITVIKGQGAKDRLEHKSLIHRQTFSQKELEPRYRRDILAKISFSVLFFTWLRTIGVGILTLWSSIMDELLLHKSVSQVFLQ